MEETKEVSNIFSKILRARKIIKEAPIKRAGRNKYSEYDYFTPDQITSLVDMACQETGLVNLFSLMEDEIGIYGQLTIVDSDTGDNVVSIMRTKMPSIKATNETQQMGGCSTYTKRYMLMDAYDISDNTLDFDSHDNRPDTVKTSEGNAKALTTKKKLRGSNKAESAEVVHKDDAVNEGIDKYQELVADLYALSTQEEIKQNSESMVKRAVDLGLGTDTVDAFKKEVNKRYIQLKP